MVQFESCSAGQEILCLNETFLWTRITAFGGGILLKWILNETGYENVNW